MASAIGSGLPLHENGSCVDARDDIQGWLAAIRRGGYDRSFHTPVWLHYKAGLQYTTHGKFFFFDFMGRRTEHDRPFDCVLEPESGKIGSLCVQTLDSICALSKTDSANCTWDRTIIRNVSPKILWAAGLPYIFIKKERRDDSSQYTLGDKVSVVLAWIFLSVPGVLLAFFTTGKSQPSGKDVEMYLPLPTDDGRFPLFAINIRENRQYSVHNNTEKLSTVAAEAGSSYRTLQPKFLYYLKRGKGGQIQAELRPVKRSDPTPYLFVAYTSAHYGSDAEDGKALVAMATFGAAHFFRKHYKISSKNDSNLDDISGKDWDPEQEPGAFWLAQGCLDSDAEVDEDGTVHRLDPDAVGYTEAAERLGNQDTYSLSDIIRGASHVCVIAGNPNRKGGADALRVWGQRVWTLAEIVLARGDFVTIQHVGTSAADMRYEEMAKTRFASRAWSDAATSRQLIENYGNLRLSRLELIKVALECLMSRKFTAQHPGDRIYAMMSLLRIRPPIDKRDSSFQAFARLSFPQDSDRLMERLICLLPDRPDEPWELMTDQYKASLWSIHPTVQVCAVGENDTVVIDGAKGAQIQWSKLSSVRTTRRVTLVRQLIPKLIEWSPSLVFLGAAFVGSRSLRDPGIALLVIGVMGMLLAPAVAPLMFQGKLWSAEPCFFGIEGYVPIDVIEAHLFGKGFGRMRWSPYGSPLSRHREGEALRERALRHWSGRGDDAMSEAEAGHAGSSSCPEFVNTYMVDPIDPCSKCSACQGSSSSSDAARCKFHETPASCQDRSRSPMGEMKVFTLIDTFSMTATLFHAARPPIALVVCGSEGGMKRAIACSLDVTTGTLYRETVLRIPSRCVDRMASLDRIRLGLRRPFLPTDVEPTPPPNPNQKTTAVPTSNSAPATSTTSLVARSTPPVSALEPQPWAQTRPDGQRSPHTHRPSPPKTAQTALALADAPPTLSSSASRLPPARPRREPVNMASATPQQTARYYPPSHHQIRPPYHPPPPHQQMMQRQPTPGPPMLSQSHSTILPATSDTRLNRDYYPPSHRPGLPPNRFHPTGSDGRDQTAPGRWDRTLAPGPRLGGSSAQAPPRGELPWA